MIETIAAVNLQPAVDTLFKYAFLGGALALALGVLSLFAPRIRGALGEKAVSRLLRRLPRDNYIVLDDIMIPNNGNTAQIDHVVLSPRGVFAIETKNYTGAIYGSERDSTWVYVKGRYKKKIQNPLRQNYGHIKALQSLLGDDNVHSVVAFTSGRIKTAMPPNVLRAGQVPDYIRSFRGHPLPLETMERYRHILETANIIDRKSRREHVRGIRQAKR